MVLLRHLHLPDTGLGANVGVKRTTSKLLVLVELLNLTFDRELHVRRDSHVKFAPPAKCGSLMEGRFFMVQHRSNVTVARSIDPDACLPGRPDAERAAPPSLQQGLHPR
ncbi:hypothetical protein CHELA40_10521 [Chelatococcus asaccharovorans]|nr:hypothetical protein CHELA40_10521 [Chelatococcus asaccharovorans]CAH1686597.1 hypothetical protein CHELA17_65086 [Chelatococcus asaccharovorans]